MKKGIIIAAAVLLTSILGIASYLYIWGGKPQIENFEDISKEYEEIAEKALHYYKELSPDKEYIIIDIGETSLEYDNNILQLSDSQIAAVKTAYGKFDYLRVCKDAVFFCEDETGYYGLVYSKAPLLALYEAELPQDGREYHRINSKWYEWGVWGI